MGISDGKIYKGINICLLQQHWKGERTAVRLTEDSLYVKARASHLRFPLDSTAK